MSLDDRFRDAATWRQSLGAGDYPGTATHAPPRETVVRDCGIRLVRVPGGDVLQRHVYWTLPGDVVRPGDRLGDGEVREVQDVKDANGSLRFRVVYATA